MLFQLRIQIWNTVIYRIKILRPLKMTPKTEKSLNKKRKLSSELKYNSQRFLLHAQTMTVILQVTRFHLNRWLSGIVSKVIRIFVNNIACSFSSWGFSQCKRTLKQWNTQQIKQNKTKRSSIAFYTLYYMEAAFIQF